MEIDKEVLRELVDAAERAVSDLDGIESEHYMYETYLALKAALKNCYQIGYGVSYMVYQYETGQEVMWSGSWGRQAPKPAKIIDKGEKNGKPVYDLDNGHWAYEYQLERAKS